MKHLYPDGTGLFQHGISPSTEHKGSLNGLICGPDSHYGTQPNWSDMLDSALSPPSSK